MPGCEHPDTFRYEGRTYPWHPRTLSRIAGRHAKDIVDEAEAEYLTAMMADKVVTEVSLRTYLSDEPLTATCLRVDGDQARWDISEECPECDDGYIQGRRSEFICPECDGEGGRWVATVITDMDGEIVEVGQP